MEDISIILTDIITVLPQVLFFAWLMHYLSPVQRPSTFIFLYTIVHLVTYTTVSWILILPSAIKSAVMCTISVAFSFLGGRRRRLFTLSITIIWLILMLLTELLVTFLSLLVFDNPPSGSVEELQHFFYPYIFPMRCAYTTCSLLLLLPFFFVWKRLHIKESTHYSPALLPFLILQAAMVFSGIWSLSLSGKQPSSFLPLLLFAVVLSCLAIGIIFWIYRQEYVRHNLTLQRQALEIQQDALQAEKAVVAFRQEQAQKLRAELNLQLEEVRTMLRRAPSAAREQLFQAAERIRCSGNPYFCNNMVVNAVITQQEFCCRSSGIILDSSLEIPQDLELSAPELCSIFSNILDNAVRVCSVLPETARKIWLSAAPRGPYLIIKEKNPLPAELSSSQRKDSGLGLGILKEIAQHHDGDVEVTQNNGYFSITLWLRMSGSELISQQPKTSSSKDTLDIQISPPPMYMNLLPWILPISQIALAGCVLVLWNSQNAVSTYFIFLLTVLLGVFADLLLVRTFRQLRSLHLQKKQVAALETSLLMQQAYWKQVEQTSLQLRRIRHDINNHLHTVSLLIEQGALEQAEAYLKDFAKVFPDDIRDK